MYKFPIKKVLTPFAALLIVAACSDQPDPVPEKDALAHISGIDLTGMDRSVRPQVDFYRYWILRERLSTPFATSAVCQLALLLVSAFFLRALVLAPLFLLHSLD